MAPVVIEVDALPQTLTLLRSAAAAQSSTTAGKRGIGSQCSHVAEAGLRRVRLRGGKKMIVLRIAGQVRLGEILEKRYGLGNRIDLPNNSGDVARPLRIGRHGGVLVQRARTALPGEREKEGVLAARFGKPRQVGRAHEGQAEAVGA